MISGELKTHRGTIKTCNTHDLAQLVQYTKLLPNNIKEVWADFSAHTLFILGYNHAEEKIYVKKIVTIPKTKK